MDKSKRLKIYVAGHRGMVGSAIVRTLESHGQSNIITRTHAELDLTDQAAVRAFFETERPEQVYLAAARVGGIHANHIYPAEFIYENLMIETNAIDAAFRCGIKKTAIPRVELPLSQTGTAAHARGCSAHQYT